MRYLCCVARCRTHRYDFTRYDTCACVLQCVRLPICTTRTAKAPAIAFCGKAYTPCYCRCASGQSLYSLLLKARSAVSCARHSMYIVLSPQKINSAAHLSSWCACDVNTLCVMVMDTGLPTNHQARLLLALGPFSPAVPSSPTGVSWIPRAPSGPSSVPFDTPACPPVPVPLVPLGSYSSVAVVIV
jgi:hypothetical protein